jgi:hypothetical protein
MYSVVLKNCAGSQGEPDEAGVIVLIFAPANNMRLSSKHYGVSDEWCESAENDVHKY